MYKKIALLAFLSALLLSMTFCTRIIIPVSASTIDVYPGPGQPIQDAINSANPGDTIFVYNGTYYEHVVINKTVSLIGENPAITIIDGNETGIVVRISASNVTLRGFTIQNGGNTTNDCGVYVTNQTERIRSNTIKNNYNGILLRIFNGSNIVGNTISNTTWAIQISSSSGNIIVGNMIANNSYGAWITSPSAISNTFHHNNFMNNTTTQASDFGSGTIWDNGYPSGGNYWSNYTGADIFHGPYQNETDGDGIGDTPHTIKFGTDYYPLMNPFIDVENPVANAGPDQSIFQGMTVTFDGSGSSDDGGIESYVWTFIDGTLKTLTGVRPQYTFKNLGNFTVTLNVTDYFGNWNTDMMWVNVSADSIEPTIGNPYQIPTLPSPNENVTITVDVADNQSGVHNVTISYRTNSGPWTNVSMSKLTGDTWEGQIPGFPNGTEVQYKIIAYDNAENVAVADNVGQYYVYTVIPEFPTTILLLLFIIFTLVALTLRKRKKGTFKL